MITQGIAFEKPPDGKSGAMRVLTAKEASEAIAFAGGFDLFLAAMTAKPIPGNCYLQLGESFEKGVFLRGYHGLLNPAASKWVREARKRVHLLAA